MSLLIQYLVKLSISLSIVWLFYQFVLRRLTFYNSNRWYLLGYTLLSFFIPFINVSSLFENRSTDIIQFVPSVHQYTVALEEATVCPAPIWSTQYDKWDFIAFGLITVAGFLLFRFIVRYFSFLRIQRNAKLISGEGVNIYQVDENIIPFSFGNSIFINSNLHSESELQEIVKHEFIHVRQKHTIDIIWAEILCIINWYNPFTWLLKRSIRQNLEFIADNKVIENGVNKKQYQYLLLKVIGNNQFSIATQFNFSSLKKRIVMMNKTKSAKRQLGRFLFLVPVFAIILLSFRKSFSGPTVIPFVSETATINDTIPEKTSPNSKGYYIKIADDSGNCTVIVKDKNKKEIKRILLTEWDAKNDYYEELYGQIPTTMAEVERAIKFQNPDVRSVTVKNNIATVTLSNGKTEVYTLLIKDEKRAFEERCLVREEAIATTVAEPAITNSVAETLTTEAVTVVSETIADDFEISDTKAVMHLRNGKTEEYNLTDPKQRAAFEKKFGRIIKPSKTTGVYTISSAQGLTKTTGAYTISPAQVTEPSLSTTVAISPAKEVVAINENDAISAVEEVETITIMPEVLLTITQKTTKEELESFKSSLKEKGFEFNYSEAEFKNGKLVRITGTVKSKDSHANFVGADFSKIIISQVRSGQKVYFRVDEMGKNKVVS